MRTSQFIQSLQEKALADGNMFTAALMKAKDNGDKTFTVAGKTYNTQEQLDKVNPDAVKKKFKDRKDKDIDNDGDVDSTDKYLHKRRKAITKAIKSDKHKEPSGEKDTVNIKPRMDDKTMIVDAKSKGQRRSMDKKHFKKIVLKMSESTEIPEPEEKKLKKIVKNLKKSVKAHDKQSKTIQKVLDKDEKSDTNEAVFDREKMTKEMKPGFEKSGKGFRALIKRKGKAVYSGQHTYKNKNDAQKEAELYIQNYADASRNPSTDKNIIMHAKGKALKEGTWYAPNKEDEMKKIIGLLKRPLPSGDEEGAYEGSASETSDKMSKLGKAKVPIGDDGFYDGVYALFKKNNNNPNTDIRPAIVDFLNDFYGFKDRTPQQAIKSLQDKIRGKTEQVISFGKQLQNSIIEARRGRPSKSGEDGEGGLEHIQVQLRKVINLRGKKDVEFQNGKIVKNIKPRDAEKALKKIADMRMGNDKEKAVRYIFAKPENLAKFVKDEKDY